MAKVENPTSDGETPFSTKHTAKVETIIKKGKPLERPKKTKQRNCPSERLFLEGGAKNMGDVFKQKAGHRTVDKEACKKETLNLVTRYGPP